MAFNKVILMGRLTADPELKQTATGVAVTSFSLAVDRKYNKGEEKQCDFVTIVAWKQTAEFICRYFKKGQAMLVCGELQTRTWTDQNGNKRHATEVLASEATFCESKKETEGYSSPTAHNASQSKFEPPAYMPDSYKQPKFEDIHSDEGLPF